jgi:hypothetical protein
MGLRQQACAPPVNKISGDFSAGSGETDPRRCAEADAQDAADAA